jgi:hypothetical protein
MNISDSAAGFHGAQNMELWLAPRSVRMGQLEAPLRRRDQCPRCLALTARPFLSKQQSGGVVTHHWQCEDCDLDWETTFCSLLV